MSDDLTPLQSLLGTLIMIGMLGAAYLAGRFLDKHWPKRRSGR